MESEQRWWVVSIQLCTFGFFKEIRPSESYLLEYLTGPWKNFTTEQVVDQIYPVGTYSILGFLVVFFLLTDYLRYKPIIIFEGATLALTYVFIILPGGIPLIQFQNLLYGMAISSEVAYYTYIYAKVDRKHYDIVTTHIYAASLVGRCVSSIIAQVLVATGAMNYEQLNYVNIGAGTVAFIIAITLPKTCGKRFLEVIGYMRSDFVSSYTSKDIVKWSFWFGFSMSIHLQVVNYVQAVYSEIDPDGNQFYNGTVDLIKSILSAVAVFGIGFVRLNYKIAGSLVLGIGAFLLAISVVTMGLTSHLWICYIFYILFTIFYQVLLVIASAEIAKLIREDSHGLIFGFNAFVGLILESIYMLVLSSLLNVDTRYQFVIYGIILFCVGILYCGTGAIRCSKNHGSSSQELLWLPKNSVEDRSEQEVDKSGQNNKSEMVFDTISVSSGESPHVQSVSVIDIVAKVDSDVTDVLNILS